VVFRPLGREDVGRIVEIQLGRLRQLLADRKLSLTLSEAAREAIADAGYDPTYGARPLKRALQRLVQDPLATKLLRGEFLPGDQIVLDEGEGGDMRFRKGEAPKA
jgi:ATP-dependent Clp protease ATP-binding subunit ClpB